MLCKFCICSQVFNNFPTYLRHLYFTSRTLSLPKFESNRGIQFVKSREFGNSNILYKIIHKTPTLESNSFKGVCDSFAIAKLSDFLFPVNVNLNARRNSFSDFFVAIDRSIMPEPSKE